MIGFLNVAKPSGMTAHDVVMRIRKLSGVKQVGHSGTLDPMAQGVLAVAVGKACRLLRFLPDEKTYLAEVLLGTATTTDDIEGSIISHTDNLPDEESVRRAFDSFVGDLDQIPPDYSAVHYQGERLYALARSGRLPADIQPRRVHIKSISVLSVTLPVVQLRIECSAGTYIRALARDVGEVLGCSGCLKSLVREQAGPFKLEDALSLEELSALKSENRLPKALVQPVSVLGLKCVELDESQADMLCHGQSLSLSSIAGSEYLFADAIECRPEELIAATCAGDLVAVCRQAAAGQLHPEVVVANAK